MLILHIADLAPYKQSFILAINSTIYEVMPFIKCQGEQRKVLLILLKTNKSSEKNRKMFLQILCLRCLPLWMDTFKINWLQLVAYNFIMPLKFKFMVKSGILNEGKSFSA